MVLLTAHVLLLAAGWWVQEAPPEKTRASVAELEAVCKSVLCRAPSPIRLTLEGRKRFEVTLPAPMPIVSGDFITVLPGETVLVEAEVKDGHLTNLIAVREVADPDRTLVFRFEQDPSLGDGTDMLLEVQSPFPGVLKYRLGMMLPSGDEILETSSCPLSQGKPVFEHWPHPIFQLIAGDFRFVDPSSSGARTCE